MYILVLVSDCAQTRSFIQVGRTCVLDFKHPATDWTTTCWRAACWRPLQRGCSTPPPGVRLPALRSISGQEWRADWRQRLNLFIFDLLGLLDLHKHKSMKLTTGVCQLVSRVQVSWSFSPPDQISLHFLHVSGGKKSPNYMIIIWKLPAVIAIIAPGGTWIIQSLLT